MKKITSLILVLCMAFSVLSGCGKSETAAEADAADTSGGTATATTAPGASTTPAATTTANTSSQQPVQTTGTKPKADKEIIYEAPTADDLSKAGVSDKFQFPSEDSYLSSKETMFVQPGSLVVLPTIAAQQMPGDPLIQGGDEVEVIAKQNGYFCIIGNADGEDVAGWVLQTALGYNSPNNTQKNVSAVDHYGVPSVTSIRNCGQEKSISLPLEEEYTSSYDRMYVSQNSVYPSPNSDGSGIFSECHLLIGDEVNVIALNKYYACILMMTDSGEKAGWVLREQLSYNNPQNESKAVSAIDHTGTPDASVLKDIGLDKSVTMPEDKDYIACFDQMYVLTNSAQVYAKGGDHGISLLVCTLPYGSEVNLLAIHNGAALTLYQTDTGEKAGWIALSSLRYNDPRNELNPTISKSYSGTPGLKDIEQLGLQKSTTLPKEDMYISSYDRMYVNQNVLTVFSIIGNNSSNEICTLASGSEVSIIAINNDLACALFETDEGTKCGWLSLSCLSYNNPSNTREQTTAISHSGTPSIKTIADMGLDKSIRLPDAKSYLSSFEHMYITEPTLLVFSNYFGNNRNATFSVVKGTEVNVIAQQEKYALILAQTDMGEKAGWVGWNTLSYNNPDTTLKIVKAASHSGTPSQKTLEDLGVDKSILLPESSNAYISSFDKMYNTLPNNQVYSHHVGNVRRVTFSMLTGTEVNVIALQDKYALILVQTDEGEKAGWVKLESLSYNNPENKKEPTTVNDPGGKPSADAVQALGLDKSVTMPDSDMYLPEYERMFVLQSGTPVMSFTESNKYNVCCTLEKGSEVYVLANAKKNAFVLFGSDEGTKCGWIQLEKLSSDNPLK